MLITTQMKMYNYALLHLRCAVIFLICGSLVLSSCINKYDPSIRLSLCQIIVSAT